uniref:Inositol hexakisphosphate and diphosphoinositol-pentakisphosphate kinase n=1 Tax=Hyaloperonospora arabidopsidis (strain Emoy2) TaxID=559515 RepID=M4BKI9_HYAAE
MTPFDTVDAKYTLGICVMERKARSDPMLEILSRLPPSLFRVDFFGDDTILNQPVTAWPRCDALVAFFSKGFPFEKAQEYVTLRRPVVVNDLNTQYILKDRREVYRVLLEHDVPTPRHVFLNRDGYGGQIEPPEVVEGDDFIQVDGVRINKPFVEKPVDGEDHHIHIYYPMSAGGGCKRLFRKIGNRSSEYDPHVNTVRAGGGSYIYEEFLSTQGTDVKVYTVGPHYAHAEARKSPVLDGRVVRDVDGKEVRYPVMLSTEEKQIAYRVCRAFRQTICGFDILRVRDASYVCDVNGWSFVKNSEKYYDDCGILLTQYLAQALAGATAGEDFGTDSSAFSSVTFRFAPNAPPPSAQLSEPPTAHRHAMLRGPSTSIAESELSEADSITDGDEDTAYQEEELRCVLAVIRHGDRTPKQKMKMNVCHPAFLQYYEDCLRGSQQENEDKSDTTKKKKKMDIKIKAVANLERLLQVSKDLLHKYETHDPAFMDFLEQREVKFGEDATDRVKGYRTLRDVLQRWQLVGINRKVQLKPKSFADVPIEGTTENGEQQTTHRVSKLLLIIKWGGDLTHTGEEQAEHLGQKFRRMMYPGGAGGLNRLHSTYRHDLKIYTSDEGRVQKTAASFAKGLLELEGDIIPILVGLVLKSKDADSMLDQSGSSAQEIIMRVKQRLHNIIHREDHCSQLIDSNSRLIRSVALALTKVDQPIKKMGIMHKLLHLLKEQLTRMIQEKAQYRTEIHMDQTTRSTDGRLPAPVMGRSASVNELSQPKCHHVHSYAPQKKHSEGKNITSDAANSSVGLRRMRPLQESLPLEDTKYPEPCGRETLEVMRERWAKLYRDFYVKKRDTYDLSKIPDIHDCIRYDAVHNAHLNLTDVRELLEISSALSHALVPQEYGIDVEEKIFIGSAMCRTLLSKINTDLDLARGLQPDLLKDHNTHRLNPSYAKKVKSAHRSVRTRLYFTSESHLHSLLNVLRYGRDECTIKSPIGEESRKWIEDIPELCYMTHFVVRVFERIQHSLEDPQRFRVEISVSPGADQDPLVSDPEKQIKVAPLKIISREGLTCQELVDYVTDCIGYAEENEVKEMISQTVASKCHGSADNTAGDSSSGDATPGKRSIYSLSDNSSDSNFSNDN